MEEKYIVYLGVVDNELVYVGKGKDGRECHLNSGKSHLYEANKYHFEGGTVKIHKIPQPDCEAATELESILIKNLSPLWNKNLVVEDKVVVYTKGDSYSELDSILVDNIKRLRAIIESNEEDMIGLEDEVSVKDEEISKLKEELNNLKIRYKELEEKEIPASLSKKELNAILRDSGYNKKERAEKIGINVRTIQRWEKQLEGS